MDFWFGMLLGIVCTAVICLALGLAWLVNMAKDFWR